MPVRVLIICLYLSHLGRIVPFSYTLYREIMRKTPSYAKIIEEIDRSSQLRRFDTVRITAWFVVFLGCIWSMIGVLLGAPKRTPIMDQIQPRNTTNHAVMRTVSKRRNCELRSISSIILA